MSLSSRQYRVFFRFLDTTIPRFSAAEKYRKYRPLLKSYKGYSDAWWLFIYDALHGEVVERGRSNWSWAHINRHTNIVNEYRKAWITYRTQKGVYEELLDCIKLSERTLDLFNLNIARHQAEVQIDQDGLTRVEDRGVQGWAAWAASFIPGVGPKGACVGGKSKITTDEIVSEIESAWNTGEKTKLYAAIDYQQNILHNEYPKEFVAYRIKARLGLTEVTVNSALKLHLKDLLIGAEYRPSSFNTALNFSALMGATFGADALKRDSLKESPISLNCIIDHKERGISVSLATQGTQKGSTIQRIVTSP